MESAQSDDGKGHLNLCMWRCCCHWQYCLKHALKLFPRYWPASGCWARWKPCWTLLATLVGPKVFLHSGECKYSQHQPWLACCCIIHSAGMLNKRTRHSSVFIAVQLRCSKQQNITTKANIMVKLTLHSATNPSTYHSLCLEISCTPSYLRCPLPGFNDACCL